MTTKEWIGKIWAKDNGDLSVRYINYMARKEHQELWGKQIKIILTTDINSDKSVDREVAIIQKDYLINKERLAFADWLADIKHKAHYDNDFTWEKLLEAIEAKIKELRSEKEQ